MYFIHYNLDLNGYIDSVRGVIENIHQHLITYTILGGIYRGTVDDVYNITNNCSKTRLENNWKTVSTDMISLLLSHTMLEKSSKYASHNKCAYTQQPNRTKRASIRLVINFSTVAILFQVELDGHYTIIELEFFSVKLYPRPLFVASSILEKNQTQARKTRSTSSDRARRALFGTMLQCMESFLDEI